MPPVGAVLVHGLWHTAATWDRVRSALEDRGIRSVAVELPLTELDADVAATTRALAAFGGPAVVVGHSYGGAVITALEVQPTLVELIYLAAFQLDEGESVSRNLVGQQFPKNRLGEAMRLSVATDEVDLDPVLGPALLYSDMPAEVAVAAAADLRPVHRLVFRGAPAQPAWQRVPSTYVVCTQDEVIEPERQRAMARRATRQLEWPCGHSPAVSLPAAVADLIAERAGAATKS